VANAKLMSYFCHPLRRFLCKQIRKKTSKNAHFVSENPKYFSIFLKIFDFDKNIFQTLKYTFFAPVYELITARCPSNTNLFFEPGSVLYNAEPRIYDPRLGCDRFFRDKYSKLFMYKIERKKKKWISGNPKKWEIE